MLFLIGTACAQEEGKKKDSRDKPHLGIKIGINRSNVYSESGEEFSASPKFGFAGGAFVSVPVGKYVGVQPEALISQKGFKGTGSILGSPYEVSRTTTYLDIPLFVSVKPTKFLSVMAGPQYSYLINRTDVFTNGYATAIQEEEFQNDDIRKNVLSASLGLDITLNHLVIAGRYAFDLQQNNGDGSSDTPHYKNAWLQAAVGLRF
jgi:hypothetical protein